MEMFQHLVDADTLTASVRHNICKQRIPACRLTMGQDFHNTLFLFCRKESDQLVNRLSINIFYRTDRRRREIQQMKHVVHRLIRIVHENLIFLHKGAWELAFLILIAHQRFNILIRNAMFIDHIVLSGKHITAVQRHITVKLEIA